MISSNVYRLMSFMTAAALALAATAAAPAKPAAAPKAPEKKYVDPNPYAGYGPAMASKKGDPMAVEWQAANKEALAKATSDDALVCFVRDDASACALLAKVKPNYATDPLVACQIAAVSQFVMRPGWESARRIWTEALFKSFQTATDDTVRIAYLDQLRWCGCKKHGDAIQVVASACKSKAVRDFAAIVVRELGR